MRRLNVFMAAAVVILLCLLATPLPAQNIPPGMALIPEGAYEMGDHYEFGYPDELPVHEVYIDSFYMDIYQVTNQKYCAYLNSAYDLGLIKVVSGVVRKEGDSEEYCEAYCDTYSHDDDSRIHWDGSTFTITPDFEDHPMTEVSAYGAAAYANWLSDQEGRAPCYHMGSWACDFDAGGYRLPTEAEWEKAVRGGEYEPYDMFPWDYAMDGSLANFWGSGDEYEGVFPHDSETTPVGYYDGGQMPPGVDMANGYGLYDMAGNVWEWCNDWYDENYYSVSPYDNPRGPASGTYHVLRGASWLDTWIMLRCANRLRNYHFTKEWIYGFRLVMDAEMDERATFISVSPGPVDTNPPLVRVFPPEAGAEYLFEFSAYGTPHYGANVICGDVNNDATDEILTGAGPGEIYGPHVRGFQVDGTPLPGLSFLAYGTNQWGVNVAAGDIDADGFDEIITGAGPGSVFGPHVRGWDYDGTGTVTAMTDVNFFAYGTPKWGVNVSAGDIDGDGYDEIVTGAGPGVVYGPHVRGWNVDGGSVTSMPDCSFIAYGTHKYGVNVSCGDVDGDGIDEIITAPGPSPLFGAHVRGFEMNGTPLPGLSFFTWPPEEVRYGANVFAGADLDGDDWNEIVVGSGPDPSADTVVKIFQYDGAQVTEWFWLEAFPGLRAGTNVAAGRFYNIKAEDIQRLTAR